MKVFIEEQRFRQLWLIVIISISTLAPIGVILKEFSDGNTDFNSPAIITIICITLLPAILIFALKLETKIDEKGIHYQFFPFHFSLKTISWSELKTAKVRTYSPIGEYGGWGFRSGFLWNKSKGKAINVAGDIGFQLEFKNGKKLLIGTQKKAEAESVLETYQNKIV
tara:strand:- start:1588 stop:2088 length:501 start_codon:yes stop_codon:yes gene_type:complete